MGQLVLFLIRAIEVMEMMRSNELVAVLVLRDKVIKENG
jgi:hypothetical protein